ACADASLKPISSAKSSILYISILNFIKRVRSTAKCAEKSAARTEAWAAMQLVMAALRFIKLTLTGASGRLPRMIDESPSDRSRFYSVAELAQEFSLTSQGIRFYEEEGLIAPARVGRTRVFNYQDRARLMLIQKLRRLGFSIDAIREYLSLYKADA